MSAAFYQELDAAGLSAFWKVISPLQHKAQPPRARLWRWDEVHRLLMEAGKLVAAQEAERRTLILCHTSGLAATTSTLTAAVQLVLPGERVPAHRHSMAALRFVISGSGAYTEVDGERIAMSPGDLVLTPAWSRHGHGNDTGEPVVWLDGLDAPLVRALKADFFKADGSEGGEEGGGGRLYRWTDMYSRLIGEASAAEANGDVVVEYANASGGGPALPTIGCFLRLLRPGQHMAARRQTGNAISYVVRGSGRTTVGDEELRWSTGDLLALPPWVWYAHANAGNEEAVLFSFTDAPVLRALGLFREEMRGH